MPEGPEIKIMADFINKNAEQKKFNKIYDVAKGNIPSENKILEGEYEISAESNGKELILNLRSDSKSSKVSVFMGMSGNWSWIPTKDWEERKFVRMRMDTTDGWSLLLYGLYMGPKYKFGGFKTKRGPDPTKEFEQFKKNIYDNINSKTFDRPICEVLLEQKFFNGVGNYIRSTILYYMNENPFEQAKSIISKRPDILDMCRDVILTSYKFGGGQLQDWTNPFNTDSIDFHKWVFYQKGISCKDNTGRTFWYDPKWQSNCPYTN